MEQEVIEIDFNSVPKPDDKYKYSGRDRYLYFSSLWGNTSAVMIVFGSDH